MSFIRFASSPNNQTKGSENEGKSKENNQEIRSSPTLFPFIFVNFIIIVVIIIKNGAIFNADDSAFSPPLLTVSFPIHL